MVLNFFIYVSCILSLSYYIKVSTHFYMPSQTEENYLKALFNLANEKNEVSLSDLSNSLNVSTPTANSMVKKLRDKGFIKYEKYKPLVVTSKGKKAAAIIIRRHRLTEMYLVSKMGFGWEEVHEIAEQIEHLKSQKFFDRMDELLGFPSLDPHGSPIPDKEGNIVLKEYAKLSDIKAGASVRLCALNNSSNGFLNYLNSKNIELGTLIQVDKIETFDKSMEVVLNDSQRTMLSNEVCDRLLVESVSN